MDSGGGGPNNSRYQRKLPSSDRLLGIFSTAHSQSQPSISTYASTSAAEVELSEHDIFDASSDAIHHSTPSTSTSPNANYHRSPNHLSHHKHFGILAALPESESHAQALLSVSSSSSSSSTSSARLIPTIPKRPPVDRVKYLQSAPVNVPVMSAAARRRGRHFDDVDDDVDGGKMLPPHEIVASRKTPILASSVVEGAGRKLKGRDLRQVRDAILQKTGFLT
ncbi:uncharacterized protein LOC125875109 [Solanum stenotomum]|uniref:uncharacterized protein LOC125875109 n=1 Tax=Solanum stenotomum TaxID=172797 RepID=UPI0020D0C6A7|nr:uncharacterized protein LOC125875109 [Solanum stenotomum]